MSQQQLKRAFLYSPTKPTKEQQERFLRFLKNKYGQEIELVWEESRAFIGGFRLEVDDDLYDWTIDGRFKMLKERISALKDSFDSDTKNSEVIPLIKEVISSWTPDTSAEEVGTVLTVGDGVATISGLKNATYGEILLFECGARGMVQNLSTNAIGCIIFDGDEDVVSGSKVRRSGKTAGVPVGDEFIGRVIDALGSPIDGKGAIKADGYNEIEHHAPGIIERQPIDKPLQTGILAIDSMFPIGRGQRELIIGDRQTGKTAIAIDTIINQKGKNVICIYVAIGQKASSVAQLVNNLSKHGAMEYTIVVATPASASAPLQYIAPYSGCAIGEYFMSKGKDVLIVYDDLSKHAIAYRSLSLLLGRSPGREAYPGDVFYLHSRLLERSARLANELGGGSITALPIVETQSGDVAAYIPTNIISITDGQIFLESDLFFAGQRPAVNVGLSVSRVGGSAQTKAIKKASGALRLDLAQYREMEVFTQFASDLDDATKRLLTYGQGLMQVLRQPQYHPYQQFEEVIILTTVLNRVIQDLPVNSVKKFIGELLEFFKKEHIGLCTRIEKSGQLSDEDKKEIIDISTEFLKAFNSRQ